MRCVTVVQTASVEGRRPALPLQGFLEKTRKCGVRKAHRKAWGRFGNAGRERGHACAGGARARTGPGHRAEASATRRSGRRAGPKEACGPGPGPRQHAAGQGHGRDKNARRLRAEAPLRVGPAPAGPHSPPRLPTLHPTCTDTPGTARCPAVSELLGEARPSSLSPLVHVDKHSFCKLDGAWLPAGGKTACSLGRGCQGTAKRK